MITDSRFVRTGGGYKLECRECKKLEIALESEKQKIQALLEEKRKMEIEHDVELQVEKEKIQALSEEKRKMEIELGIELEVERDKIQALLEEKRKMEIELGIALEKKKNELEVDSTSKILNLISSIDTLLAGDSQT